MKFEKLNRPIKPQKIFKPVYWTTHRCKELVQHYHLDSSADLRKRFDGYSIASIRRKATELKRKGWYFARTPKNTS